MPAVPVLLPALVLVVFGGVIFAVWLARRPRTPARTLALIELTKRLGWRFLGEPRCDGFDTRYSQFDKFDRGHTRYAQNRLAGTIRGFGAELAAEAGDYYYEIAGGPGKDSGLHTCRFSYLLVSLPFGPLLPSLRVRPDDFVDKLSSVGGFENIDFGPGEFSKRHHVSADNPRFAYTLMDPGMIEFLLAAPPPLFELAGGVLLIVSAPGAEDSRWSPDGFTQAAAWATGFLAGWPPHLVTDLRARC